MPRFLGRENSGDRQIRRRRPAAVNSKVTSGTTPCAAWSLRRLARAPVRAPGTAAYRAKQMASRMLVLPAPVGPWIRNRPQEASASRSIASWPAKGPKAVMARRCNLTAHCQRWWPVPRHRGHHGLDGSVRRPPQAEHVLVRRRRCHRERGSGSHSTDQDRCVGATMPRW